MHAIAMVGFSIHDQFSPYMVLLSPYMVKIDCEYHLNPPSVSASVSVGDRVVCGADKVLGNKPAKQRYGRLFRKELQGVVKGGKRT